jgi:PKD repeat protein
MSITRNLLILITLASCFVAKSANSQQHQCGSTHYFNEWKNANPQANQQFELLQQQIQTIINQNPSTNKQTRGSVYTIPVVVHILHSFTNDFITDAQVYDAINILNNDYNKLNADTSAVVPSFVNSVADMQIEFKLARKDPQGNCTNGIDRIYTYKSQSANDQGKLNQWDRTKYLNIWVVNDFLKDDVGGYAYFASMFTGGFGSENPLYDGIMILNTQFGSIGTGSVSGSRSLTHECGHYFDLFHVWGNFNAPTVACGDDGIPDTPPTKGFLTCDLNAANCTTGLIENVQNFMEYSFCCNMFTNGQKDKVHSIITNNIGQRKSLTLATTAAATGINLPVSDCPPRADFSATKFFACKGSSQTISFVDRSWADTINTYTWSLPNANTSASTLKNLVTYYDTPGWQTVTHSATSNMGTDTKTKNNFIYISDPANKKSAGYVQDFEPASNPQEWPLFNHYNNELKFAPVPFGRNGGTCLKLNTRDRRLDPIFKSVNTYEGDIDEIISPAFDLTGQSNVKFNFFSSGGSDAFSVYSRTDRLSVWYSKNCGISWTQIGVFNDTLGNLFNFTPQIDSFKPNGVNDWVLKSVNIPTAAISAQTYFKIRYRASAAGNDFYIDDINVSPWPLGITNINKNEFNLVVYPNPSDNGKVNIIVPNTKDEVTITDISGKVVYQPAAQQIAANNGLVELNQQLHTGLYFVNLIHDGVVVATQKLVIR